MKTFELQILTADFADEYRILIGRKKAQKAQKRAREFGCDLIGHNPFLRFLRLFAANLPSR